jgi:serine/threonine-protein kinase RsbW
VDQVHGEQLRLTMPATPQLMRVARLTAAGLASRLGFSLDEVEDLKIAVDELCFAMVGTRGREGTLTLVYRMSPDSLEIEGTSDFVDPAVSSAATELSALILAAVVDEHEISDSDSTMHFRLKKRRAQEADRPG